MLLFSCLGYHKLPSSTKIKQKKPILIWKKRFGWYISQLIWNESRQSAFKEEIYRSGINILGNFEIQVFKRVANVNKKKSVDYNATEILLQKADMTRILALKSNFSLFYQYQDKKSQCILFKWEYRYFVIFYLSDIRKRKFKLENIIKHDLNQRTKKATKILS